MIIAVSKDTSETNHMHCAKCGKYIVFNQYCPKCKCLTGVARRWFGIGPKIVVAYLGRRPHWREVIEWHRKKAK